MASPSRAHGSDRELTEEEVQEPGGQGGSMDLEELRERLTRFMRAHLDDPGATIASVEKGRGHAGSSYFFETVSDGLRASYFLRLPPPGVKYEGNTGLVRQVAAMKALKDTDIPHAPILWWGMDEQWFGCPYFVQPRLKGETLKDEHLARFSAAQLRDMARQAMVALAGIHRIDPAKAPYLGEYRGFAFDVTRWDRLYERAAEPELLALQARVRELLLERIPHESRIAICHGDFQWANLLYSPAGKLSAVIGWKRCGIGPVLNDVGRICVLSDPSAWTHQQQHASRIPHGDEIEEWYREASGDGTGDIRWFKALAAYQLASAGGFNLMPHRRGEHDDPHREVIEHSMQSNLEYALRMLTA